MKARYDDINQLVKEFRKELNITSPRVDMSRVCEIKGWNIVASKLPGEKAEAVTFEYKGFYEIHLPQERRYWCRVKWSLCHECAHIYLRHFEEFNLSPLHAYVNNDDSIDVLDTEANFFTSEVLMSKEFILENYHKGSEYLRRVFGVSREAIRNRLDNLGLLGIVEAASTNERHNTNGPSMGTI